ncbi:MAG: hypothetical protein KC438_10755 [Thermomicrobiales bacterium]|nr:hypothetical protein [Thermomicrobiales bacterium]
MNAAAVGLKSSRCVWEHQRQVRTGKCPPKPWTACIVSIQGIEQTDPETEIERGNNTSGRYRLSCSVDKPLGEYHIVSFAPLQEAWIVIPIRSAELLFQKAVKAVSCDNFQHVEAWIECLAESHIPEVLYGRFELIA